MEQSLVVLEVEVANCVFFLSPNLMLSIRLSRPSCLSFSGFFLLALYSMSGPSQLPRVGLGYGEGGGGGVGRGKVYIFDRFISWVFSVCLGSFISFISLRLFGTFLFFPLPFCWVIVLYSSIPYYTNTHFFIHTLADSLC